MIKVRCISPDDWRDSQLNKIFDAQLTSVKLRPHLILNHQYLVESTELGSPYEETYYVLDLRVNNIFRHI